jgi:hypothetical protein
MDIGGSFPRLKADHSTPASAEVKNGGAIPSLPHTSSYRTWIANEEVLLVVFF